MGNYKRLKRSTTDVWLGGVCGGIAVYFDIDPTLVRIGYVVLSLGSAAFPGLLIYLILWMIMPKE